MAQQPAAATTKPQSAPVSSPGMVGAIYPNHGQSSADKARQQQLWKNQLDSDRLSKPGRLNQPILINHSSGEKGSLPTAGRSVGGAASNVATNKLRQNPGGAVTTKTGAARRSASNVLRSPGKAASNAAKATYEAASDAVEKIAEDPMWTGMWILIFSFSFFADLITLIPFVGSVFSIFFAIIINMIYLIFGYYKKLKFAKGAINFITALIELVVGFLPVFLVSALLNFFWMTMGERQMEHLTGEEE